VIVRYVDENVFDLLPVPDYHRSPVSFCTDLVFLRLTGLMALRFRSEKHLQALLIVCTLCIPRVVFSQNDPFGASDAGFLQPDQPNTNNRSALESDEEVEDDPLVDQLRIKARYGGIQLAEAISSLARIGRWSAVNELLGQINDATIAPEMLAEMSKRIEPALGLRIDRSEAIDDKARGGLTKLRDAQRELARSEPRLEAAIQELDDPSIDKQIAAARTLLAGGNAAVKRLVEDAVMENPPAARDSILRTLLRFDDEGTRALRQLAIYGKPSERLGALQSLVRIDKNASLGLLLSTHHWPDASEAELAFADTTLRQANRPIASREQSIEYLARQMATKVRYASQIDNDLATRSMWFVNKMRDGVGFQTARLLTAVYRDAVDIASLLRRFESLPPDVANDVLIAELNYNVMLDLDWGDTEQIAEFRSTHASVLVQTSLENALSAAIQSDSQPAVIGLLRIMGSETNTALHNQWLTSASPQPSPLVRAAMSATARVRYEAAAAIAGFGLTSDYPGRSFVMQTQSEMATLPSLPTAILIETRPEVIVEQETILSKLGFNVRVASSVADAEAMVNMGGDLRLLVSKTQLPDQTPTELIDRVRRLSRGKHLPIVFYGTYDETVDMTRWEAPVIYRAKMPRSEAAFYELFDLLQRRSRLPAMTPFDRQVYREKAKLSE